MYELKKLILKYKYGYFLCYLQKLHTWCHPIFYIVPNFDSYIVEEIVGLELFPQKTQKTNLDIKYSCDFP
jgi:ubiquinone biosynthesis protein Coq4